MKILNLVRKKAYVLGSKDLKLALFLTGMMFMEASKTFFKGFMKTIQTVIQDLHLHYCKHQHLVTELTF